MISLPSYSRNSDYFALQQQESVSVSATATNADGNRAIQVSASYSSSTTVSLGSAEQALTYAPKEVSQAQSPPAGTDASDNILNFIGLRLQQDVADGASAEEVASRLQAAYDGFLEGYGEAYDVLSSAGLLSPEIEDAITQTYDAVLAGIDALAEQYGVNSPTQSVPEGQEEVSLPVEGENLTITTQPAKSFTPAVDPQVTFADYANDVVAAGEDLSALLQSSRFDYDSLVERDFSFSLKTQDGDTVTISASANYGFSAQARSVSYDSPYSNYNGSRVGVEQSSSSQFNLQIDGDLDEDELAAIEDLLVQVGQLSDSFYDGNIEDAFEMALNIGFDESEIAQFSLSLKQEVTTKVEAAYGQYSQNSPLGDSRSDLREQLAFANGDNSIGRLLDFIQLLEDTLEKSGAIGLEASGLADLVGNVAGSRNQEPGTAEKVASFVEKMLPLFGEGA